MYIEKTTYICEIVDNDLLKTFKDYLEEKVQNSLGEHTASEEILYFKRIEIMREDVLLRYPTMDESFLDAILDEHYQELYE